MHGMGGSGEVKGLGLGSSEEVTFFDMAVNLGTFAFAPIPGL